jgi:hypothetical protein
MFIDAVIQATASGFVARMAIACAFIVVEIRARGREVELGCDDAKRGGLYREESSGMCRCESTQHAS